MGKKEEEEAASYNIPEDVYGEILYRLPSKDLLRFKLVCKDWQRLISSKQFIQKHLQRSKADCNHLRILVDFESKAEIIIIDCTNKTSKKISFDQMHILGCCDGLVLYYNSWLSKLAAFNPCTGDSLLLVTVPKQYSLKLGQYKLKFSWFGRHPVTGQYVSVLAYRESGTIKFEVHTLSPDRNGINLLLFSSTTLDLDQPGFKISYWSNSNEIGTLLHGRLHFPGIHVVNSGEFSSKHVILVYDFETNKIMRMKTPSYSLHHHVRMLGVVDGCLCAFQDEQVWIMKEYGVEQSWTKCAKIDRYIYPLAFSPNGDVMFITSDDWCRKLISKYSLREREAKILYRSSTTVRFYREFLSTACIDSLVSPTLLFKEDE